MSVSEGAREHRLLQSGDVSVHLVVTRPPRPRIIFAFPAGNSGAGLWPSAAEVAELALAGEVEPWRPGAELRGAQVRLRVRPASGVVRLRPVLDSVRVLRDHDQPGALARRDAIIRRCRPQGPPPVRLSRLGSGVVAERAALDGVHAYRFEVAPGAGVSATVEGSDIVLRFDRPQGGEVVMRAAQSFTPLTPLTDAELFRPGFDATRRSASAQHLAMLAYREKFLAGSWQYLTYFGRDTLLSARMLLPALAEPALRAAIGSVLARLSPEGAVAHEEDIGDQAALDHLQQSCSPPQALTAPVYDYKMVDGELMILPLLRDIALGPSGRRPADRALFSRLIGEHRAAFARSLDFVLRETGRFARSRRATDLIALRPGLPVGDWRDSETGLGGGRYAASINVALAPSALEALRQLLAAGVIDAAELRTEAARLPALRELLDAPGGPQRRLAEWTRIWRGARKIFEVRRPFRFEALSLDEKGRPIPVMHSDDVLILLDENVPAAELAERLLKYEQLYPRGLRLPVGIVVANASHSPRPGDAKMFGPDRYHGAVMWGWPELVLDVGLVRQLTARDRPLPEALKRRVGELRRTIAAARSSAGPLAQAELRTWRREGGKVVAVAFGAESGAETEANPVQLWSTLELVDPDRFFE
jgi:hypothetical protein